MHIHIPLLVAGLLAAANPGPPVQTADPSHRLLAEEASGELRFVSGNDFTLRAGDTDVTLKTSERTRYTLDGEAAERHEVLQVGRQVTVTHEGGVALSVARTNAQLVAPEELRGQIRGVESDTFILAHGDRTTHMRVDENTRYVLDGEDATREDVVRVGYSVEVEHQANLALRVERNTSKATVADTTRGTVGDVAEDGFTLTTGGEKLRLSVDDETRYFADGEPSERAEVLRAGRVVTVEHTAGKAKRVEAIGDEALQTPRRLEGEIRAVDRSGFFVLHEDEELRLRTDADTEYRLDGDIAPRSVVLQAGRVVEIRYRGDFAILVSAFREG